tara:strand:+ start:1477 stop:1701 length:225 start_codon:yes stop_codon:yes gene_type:complete
MLASLFNVNEEAFDIKKLPCAFIVKQVLAAKTKSLIFMSLELFLALKLVLIDLKACLIMSFDFIIFGGLIFLFL